MIIDKSTKYRELLQDVVRHFDINWDSPWPSNMLTQLALWDPGMVLH